MSVELVIFDCDGVLVDSEHLSARCVSEVLADYGYIISGEEIDRRFAGITDRQIGEIIAAEGGSGLPDDFGQQVERRSLEVFETELEAAEGIAALLEGLPHPRCVASNSGRKRLRRSLEYTGLWRFFSEKLLFSADQVSRPKPAPDLHHLVLANFSVDPRRAVVIEDSVTGASAALAAGIPVIGYVATSPDPQAQAEKLGALGVGMIIDDLARVPGLIAKL